MKSMKNFRRLLTGAIMATTLAAAAAAQQASTGHWAIVVHGGAGVIERSALGPEGTTSYRASLARAEAAGAAVLDRGGSALDAV